MVVMRYITHEAPVGRAASNYIAMVDLAPFGFADQCEQVWLSEPAGGVARLACLPFRVYGLARYDVVGLDPAGQRVVELIEPSGHRLLRVLLAATGEPGTARLREAVVAAVTGLGLAMEWSGERHVAVDMPPGSSVGPLEPLLRPHLTAGTVQWEWADAEPFRC